MHRLLGFRSTHAFDKQLTRAQVRPQLWGMEDKHELIARNGLILFEPSDVSWSETYFQANLVSSGHPDKLCDAISDAIVDACLSVDPHARVAVETCVKGKSNRSLIVLAGEVTVKGDAPDYEQIARKAAASIGYDSHIIGMDATSQERSSSSHHYSIAIHRSRC